MQQLPLAQARDYIAPVVIIPDNPLRIEFGLRPDCAGIAAAMRGL